MESYLEEEWRTIRDYPDYIVSTHGRVYNTRRNRILTLSRATGGYLSAALLNGHQYKNHMVHRLVAFEFVDGYFDGAFVNHLDGDKQNNHYENLEWVTHADNMRHAAMTGLMRKQRALVLDTHEGVVTYRDSLLAHKHGL